MLVHLEPLAFDDMGSGFHVRATFVDEGRQREAVWFYRIRDEEWSVSVNARLATALDGRAVDVFEVSSAVAGGVLEQLVRYREVGGDPVFAQDLIAVVGPDQVIDTDLLLSITGESANAPIDRMLATADGRFVALQTLASNLAPSGDIDSNACADIYLIDRVRATLSRVTILNGLETATDAYLEDLRLGIDGVLSVAFSTGDPALSTADRNEVADVFVWRLPAATSDTPGTPNLVLVSAAAGQAQGGTAAQLSSRGIAFQSEGGAFSSLDTNAVSDIWVLVSGSAPVPAWPGGLVAAGGMSLLDVDASGDRLLVSGQSTAFSLGNPNIDQLALIDVRAGTLMPLSVAPSGAPADDAVLAAILSPNGVRAVFSSAASNLRAEADGFGTVGLFLYSPDTAPSVQGDVKHWKSGAPIPQVRVSATDPAAGPGTPAVALDDSDAEGRFRFDGLDFQAYEFTARRSSLNSDPTQSVSAADVLAALKLASGRNPNPDPDGATGSTSAAPPSAFQLIAADADGDGRVTRSDAGLIAELASAGTAAQFPAWRFVEPGAELHTLTRDDVRWTGAVRIDVSSAPEIAWVGVLPGDVDGNWQGFELEGMLNPQWRDAG